MNVRDSTNQPKDLHVNDAGELLVAASVTATVDNGTKVDAASALGAGGVGPIGWLSTIWLRLTTGLPASLGAAASAAALPVALATDDAQIGAKVTAVTALGAGGSGIIGWLSAIANFVKGLPSTLGLAASAASVPVVIASDDAQIGTKITAVTALGAGGAGLIGWLSNIWLRLSTGLPAALGSTTAANSLPVTLSTDGPFAVNVGAVADAAATTDTGSFSIIAFIKRSMQNWATIIGLHSNPAVVTGNITAAVAVPVLVTDLIANTSQSIAGGTVDAVTIRVNSIAGGAATGTVSFFGSDDGVNLFPISGLPIGGAIGSGSFVLSTSAVGAWQVKGSAARTIYAVGTAVGAGATLNVSLSATPNQSRVTSILRGSLGGSVSSAAGAVATEVVSIQGAASGTAVPTTVGAGEAHVGEVGGRNALVVSTFTRLGGGDATPYASGDYVGQAAAATGCSAASVVIGRGSSGVSATGMLRRLRLRKNGTSITNAQFRVHFFNSNPTPNSVVTISIASPGVVTWNAHGLATGCPIIFATTGALPTGLVAGTVYYAIKVDANTFQLASSSANAYAGTAINTTGSQSGVQTAFAGLGVGDNGALSLGAAPGLLGMTTAYVGAVDVTLDKSFADGAAGNGVPNTGSEINFASQTYYWILEARGAYTPISAEVFEIACEVLQN